MSKKTVKRTAKPAGPKGVTDIKVSEQQVTMLRSLVAQQQAAEQQVRQALSIIIAGKGLDPGDMALSNVDLDSGVITVRKHAPSD